MRTRAGHLAAGAGLLLVLVACGGEEVGEQAAERVAEEQIEAAGGGDAEVDIDDGEVKVETSEGTVSMGRELPEDFPEDVPLVDGTILMAAASPDQGGWFVTLTPENPDDAFEDATTALTDAGFELGETTTFGATSTAQLTRDGLEVTVTAADASFTYTVVAD